MKELLKDNVIHKYIAIGFAIIWQITFIVIAIVSNN